MKQDYGGVIWTNHALERLQQRDIAQGDAWATFRRPDRSRPGQKKGVYVYYKTWDFTDSKGRKRYERIEVVATQNERNEWIILSVWSKPVKKTDESMKKKGLLSKIVELFGL